jgi:hypothetical protein
MEPIPEELVEETWQEVSSFASGRVIKEMGNPLPLMTIDFGMYNIF